MFYGETIQDTRQFFVDSWVKYKQKATLQPMEKQLVDVILLHPEYHDFIDSTHLEVSYFPELGQSNPFLHMGLHLTIREQVTTNRPNGISDIFKSLLKKYSDMHVVEHLIMEPLAECLWHAQRTHSMPNEEAYLNACREL